MLTVKIFDVIFFSLLNVNINDFQVGPHFLPPRLNGENYADFLENWLSELLNHMLDDIPLRERAQLIFQHDRTPAHFRRNIRDLWNARYPD